MYICPSVESHLMSIDSLDFTTPCMTLELAPGDIGSLTMYWRSLDKMGIANPPAESIAAVDPAAVDTLRPLDLLFTNEEHCLPSLQILSTERIIN